MNQGGKMKKKLRKFEHIKEGLIIYIADGDLLTQRYFNGEGYKHTGNVYVSIESMEGV